MTPSMTIGWLEFGTAALPVTALTLAGGKVRIHAVAVGPLHVPGDARSALRGIDGLLVYVGGSALGEPLDLDHTWDSLALTVDINLYEMMPGGFR